MWSLVDEKDRLGGVVRHHFIPGSLLRDVYFKLNWKRDEGFFLCGLCFCRVEFWWSCAHFCKRCSIIKWYLYFLAENWYVGRKQRMKKQRCPNFMSHLFTFATFFAHFCSQKYSTRQWGQVMWTRHRSDWLKPMTKCHLHFSWRFIINSF